MPASPSAAPSPDRSASRRRGPQPVRDPHRSPPVGKTTLVRALFPDHVYLSREAPDLARAGNRGPAGFPGAGDRLILDEIQREPDLLSYIQVLVDEDDRPGRFILTGSQNILLMESVSQTLGGADRPGRAVPAVARRAAGTAACGCGKPGRGRRGPWGRRAGPHPWKTLVDGFYPRIHDRGRPGSGWRTTSARTSNGISARCCRSRICAASNASCGWPLPIPGRSST